jgi:hypothetical protein
MNSVSSRGPHDPPSPCIYCNFPLTSVIVFIMQLYLQSLLVQTANCAKTCTVACTSVQKHSSAASSGYVIVAFPKVEIHNLNKLFFGHKRIISAVRGFEFVSNRMSLV